MPRKKDINWPAIKKRYLQGEKPKSIAADFGITAKQISDKARREGWKRKKSEISAKVEEKVENELLDLKKRLLAEWEYLAFSRMSRLQEWDSKGVSLKKSSDLTDAEIACIAEVVKTQFGVKVKLHSKARALEVLSEYAGIIQPKDNTEEPKDPTQSPLLQAIQGKVSETWSDFSEAENTEEGE